jgi:hypothetical protein
MNIAVIPNNPPAGDRWKQRVCITTDSTKRIVLHDHSGGLYLPSNQYDSLKIADVEFKEHFKVSTDVANLVHVVAHVESRDVFTTGVFEPPAEGQTAVSGPLIVLQVSRPESVADASESSDRIVWLSMKSREAYKKVSDWLKQFLDLSFEDAVKIAKESERAALDPDIQRKYAQLLDITHPGDPAAPLAFRLLCEAWYEKNVAGESELSGFPITAPTILDDWLAPFSADEKVDPASIASVCAKMGDNVTKVKVEQVLNDAKGDPRTHILAFLGIKEQATVQSEGGAQ